jgi:hypothetical protein
VEQSLTTVIILSITIVVVAAVLGVLIYGANQASDIAGSGYTFFDELGNPDPLNINALSGSDIPIAAVAALIRGHKAQIISLDCRFCHVVSAEENIGECLTSHLQGRGRLTLTDAGERKLLAVLLPG